MLIRRSISSGALAFYLCWSPEPFGAAEDRNAIPGDTKSDSSLPVAAVLRKSRHMDEIHLPSELAITKSAR